MRSKKVNETCLVTALRIFTLGTHCISCLSVFVRYTTISREFYRSYGVLKQNYIQNLKDGEFGHTVYIEIISRDIM